MPANIGRMTASVNGHLTGGTRLSFWSSYRPMSHLEEVFARIEKRLSAMKLSASAASKLANKPEAIRNIQRAMNGGSGGERQGVSTATLNALAPVLGTTAIWLFAGAGPEEPGLSITQEQRDERILHAQQAKANFVEAAYGGTLQAGSFREVDDATDEDRGPYVVPRDDRFPRADYVIFDVAGDSMNAATPPIPEGSRVLAVRTDNYARPIALRTGDIVVVQRTRAQGGMIERSVKELEMGDAETRYLPRSTNKRHQPIVVPNQPDTDDETTVEVLGLVVSIVMNVRRR